MTTGALKAYSTRRIKRIPPEFEDNFIEGGWPRVNTMYGKRCANRWFVALGAERLKEARKQYLTAARSQGMAA